MSLSDKIHTIAELLQALAKLANVLLENHDQLSYLCTLLSSASQSILATLIQLLAMINWFPMLL